MIKTKDYLFLALKLLIVGIVFLIAIYYNWAFWDMIIMLFFSISVLFILDSRYSASLALFFLILTPIFLSLKKDIIAEIFAVNTYYFLVIAVLTQIRELDNFKKEKETQDIILLNFYKKINNFFIKRSKIIIPLGVLLFILGISTNYFISSGIPHNSFLDMGGNYAYSKKVLEDFLIGWSFDFSFSFNYVVSNLNLFIVQIINIITRDLFITVKLMQFVFIISSFIGIIKLFQYLTKFKPNHIFEYFILFLIGIIYSVNPFFLVVLSGVLEFSLAYASLPWIIYLWLKLLNNEYRNGFAKFYFIVLLGFLVSMTTITGSVLMTFTNGIPLFIFFVTTYVVSFKDKFTLPTFIRKAELGLFVGIITILVASHFLIPTFFAYRTNNDFVSDNTVNERTEPFVKDYYSPTFFEILNFQNKEGLVSDELGYDIKDITIGTNFIWPIVSIIGALGIFLVWRNWYLLGIWLMGGLSFWLSLGYSQSWLYRFLNEKLPYFWGLRTPGRFMMTFILAVTILFGYVIYFIYSNLKWKASKQVILIGVLILLLGGFFSARVYSKGVLKTFVAVPDLAYHYPGMNEIQDYMAKLNPDQKYRILDLTQDDDGSWLHTRFLVKNQRNFNQFNLILEKFSPKERIEYLKEYNVKYIITSDFKDYCSDEVDNTNRSKIACDFIKGNKLKFVHTTSDWHYTVWEVRGVKSYLHSEKYNLDFSRNLKVETQDAEEIIIAETYSPQFKFVCEKNGEIQASVHKDNMQKFDLPEGDKCIYSYHQTILHIVAEWLSYGILVFTVLGGVIYIGFNYGNKNSNYKPKIHLNQFKGNKFNKKISKK